MEGCEFSSALGRRVLVRVALDAIRAVGAIGNGVHEARTGMERTEQRYNFADVLCIGYPLGTYWPLLSVIL